MPRFVKGPRAWPRAPLRFGTEDGTNRLSRGNIMMEVTAAEGTLTGLFIHLIPVHVTITPAVGTLTGQNIDLLSRRMDVVPAEGRLIGQSITLLP